MIHLFYLRSNFKLLVGKSCTLITSWLVMPIHTFIAYSTILQQSWAAADLCCQTPFFLRHVQVFQEQFQGNLLLSLSPVSVVIVSPVEKGHPAAFPRAHPSSYFPPGPHCRREQTQTIKLFLRDNSVFTLLNLIQMCILFVTPLILFSQEGSNDKQITTQKHVSSVRQFQSY